MNSSKLFYEKYEIIKFERNLRDIVDSILIFIENDASVIHKTSIKFEKESNDNFEYTKIKGNYKGYDIIEITSYCIVNDQASKNFRKKVKKIDINSQEKKVIISYDSSNIDKFDVELIEKIITEVMFNYYQTKLPQSRITRQQNLAIANQDKHKLFNAINSIKRNKENYR